MKDEGATGTAFGSLQAGHKVFRVWKPPPTTFTDSNLEQLRNRRMSRARFHFLCLHDRQSAVLSAFIKVMRCFVVLDASVQFL